MRPDDPRHGTPAGYETHRRHGQRPCTDCREAKNAAERARRAAQRPATRDDIALTDGRWVNVRGVMRWVPGEPEAPRERPRLVRPLLTPADVAQMIACPRCLARVCEPCRTRTGNSTTHTERLIPRRCLCGEPLRARKTLCEPCRELSRQDTYRRREITTPTALRRRSTRKDAA